MIMQDRSNGGLPRRRQTRPQRQHSTIYVTFSRDDEARINLYREAAATVPGDDGSDRGVVVSAVLSLNR